jgi:hypothetical protein
MEMEDEGCTKRFMVERCVYLLLHSNKEGAMACLPDASYSTLCRDLQDNMRRQLETMYGK